MVETCGSAEPWVVSERPRISAASWAAAILVEAAWAVSIAAAWVAKDSAAACATALATGSTARRRRGRFQDAACRYAGQDNGWIGLYINPVTYAFWEEMKANPNIPYKPFGAGS